MRVNLIYILAIPNTYTVHFSTVQYQLQLMKTEASRYFSVS